ncbi:MAG TPA: MerR family transcriptional regulator [bacterium]|jgi:MerR family copper efflux transcriptional regulator|nr:MerR family transcriptional regulator [bacterium]
MKSKSAALQIGQVAKKSKASIHTIRYYEKMGLLKKPGRTAGGFRLYPPETVDQLVFIRKAQDLGLTLREVKQITGCGDKGLGPCCDLTVNIFTRKVGELEGKIAELEAMKSRLKSILTPWVAPHKLQPIKERLK